MATTTSGPSRVSQRTDPATQQPLPAPAARPGRWPKTALYVLAIIGVLVAVGYGSTRLLGSFGSSTGPVLSTYTVTRGELLITVTEDGNVESARNEDIKCQVAGGSAILSLVEDGQIVKKGDKLVELDASSLVDQINTQKIAYNKARSSVIQAEKNYQVAQISVKEYIQGTFVMHLEDSDALITIAEENLRSSQNSLQYAERMFQRGYISQLELESRQFAVKRSQLELNSSKTAKSVLVDFTKVKTMEDLKSQVETAKATMESERAAFELEEGKLKRLETQLANCTIIAPQDGMVVYANERGRFGEQGSAVEEGASVRDRQTILRLPDLNHMQVKVKVHETKVEDLQYGMRARINVQGRELRGVVTSVANQPESTTWFQGNVKEYATIVEIEGQPGGLRPGMTAEVEILVSHLKDILTLPVSAVVEQRGEFFCWVKKPQMPPERQPLVLGQSNDQFVEVREGLAEGDQVIRNPRAVIADAKSDKVVVEQVDVTKKFGDAQRGSAGNAGGDSGSPASSGDPAAGTRPGGQGRQGGGGQGRQGGGGPGQQGGGGPGGGGRGASFDLNQFDTDGDGKVSKDEAPGPMKSFFDRIDEDGDGFLDEKEAEALQKRLRSGGTRRSGGSRESPGDTPGSQGDAREKEEGARESRE